MPFRSLRPTAFRLARPLAACTALVLLSAAARMTAIRPSVVVPSYAVPLASATSGSVRLSEASASVIVATLASSNPAIAWVPGNVAFQPRTTEMPFIVRGVAPGCATVSATAAGATSGPRHIVVHPASPDTDVKLTVRNIIYPLGASVQTTFTTTSRAVGTATLSSSNPSVALVPATTTFARGSGAFTLAARGIGCAIISVTVGGNTSRKTVQVIDIGG